MSDKKINRRRRIGIKKMGIPKGKKISSSKLKDISKEIGIVSKRASLSKTLQGLHAKRK